MKKLAKKNLGFWYKLDQKKITRLRGHKLSKKTERDKFIKNLYKFGYNKITGFKYKKSIKKVLKKCI